MSLVSWVYPDIGSKQPFSPVDAGVKFKAQVLLTLGPLLFLPTVSFSIIGGRVPDSIRFAYSLIGTATKTRPVKVSACLSKIKPALK